MTTYHYEIALAAAQSAFREEPNPSRRCRLARKAQMIRRQIRGN